MQSANRKAVWPIIVMGVGVGSFILYKAFTPVQNHPPQSTRAAIGPGGGIPAPPSSKPGAPADWEQGLQVATYSMVNLLHGNVLTEIPIVDWSGIGPDIDYRLYHNSADGVWRATYSRELTIAADKVTYVRDDGRAILFTLVETEWVPEAGYFLELVQADKKLNIWTITTKDQWVMTFVGDPVARLQSIQDSAGNVLTITGSSWESATITDASTPPGRKLVASVNAGEVTITDPQLVRHSTITRDGSSRITSIADAMGYWIVITYEPGADRIESITDKYEGTSGDEYTYGYDNGKLASVTDPSPLWSYVQTFAFTMSTNSLPVTTYTNKRGFVTKYKYDSDYNLTAVTDPDKTVNYTRDADRNVTTYQDGVGHSWVNTYDDQGNRLTATDPLLNVETWTYDQYNNVESYADGEGKVWQFTYDDQPPIIDPTNLEQVILPDVGQGNDVITITYYESGPAKIGLLESVTDANGVKTTFDYDEYGQILSEEEGVGPEGEDYTTVVTDHDFDAGSRHILSVRWGSCGMAPPEAPPTGGNTHAAGSTPRSPRVTQNTCIFWALPAACDPGSVVPEPAFEEYSQYMPNAEYDAMGRAKEINGFINNAGFDEADVDLLMDYDAIGRMTSLLMRSNEACWDDEDPNAPNINVGRQYTYNYDGWLLGGVTERASQDGIRTDTTVDALDRVTLVEAYQAGAQTPIFRADYVYLDNRDLVASITYGNGTMIVYEYDNADRLTVIKHWVDGQPNPFLRMDYTFDGRNLITQVIETDESGTVTTVTFVYDARRRLTHETRVSGGPIEYDLEYAYDAGGNRTTKIDHLNATTTRYYYDVDTGAAYTHRANRLMYYDTRLDSNNYVLERVEYEYALDGDPAGNVNQVFRFDPIQNGPNGDILMAHVFGTHFTYDRWGEVRIVTQRHWMWDTGGFSQESYLKVREFRGNGRTRHMTRERDVITLAPDDDSAVWTDYDGDFPSADYIVTSCEGSATVQDQTHYHLGLAEIDYCDPAPCDDVATYTHTDHLGTTRARTDDVPAPFARPVYTAFGERVDTDGWIGTRYGYVGKEGYETFDGLDWGDYQGTPAPFEFIHTGHRWYDPSTGRFLQRDPIGVPWLTVSPDFVNVVKDLNVYVYAGDVPTSFTDPKGMGFLESFKAATNYLMSQIGNIARRVAAWLAGASPPVSVNVLRPAVKGLAVAADAMRCSLNYAYIRNGSINGGYEEYERRKQRQGY